MDFFVGFLLNEMHKERQTKKFKLKRKDKMAEINKETQTEIHSHMYSKHNTTLT